MNNNELRLTATHRSDYSYETKTYTHHLDAPQGFDFKSPYFGTREEADAFAALFPKAAKFVSTFVTGREEDGIRFFAVARGHLTPNKATGAINETAIKRYRSIVKAAERLGFEIVMTGEYVNAYADRETFEAALTKEEVA